MLCLIVLLSQLVSSRRNNFSVGLSTIAEQENKAVGDPKEIEDLHYSFYIADAIMNGKSVELMRREITSRLPMSLKRCILLTVTKNQKILQLL